MTEQNKDRPFAEGDLVIVPKFGARTLKIIDRIRFNPNMAGLTDKDTTICLKPYGQCKPSDIKTIRTPRKGGKEARDIVAKCLLKVRWLRDTKDFTWKHEVKDKHPTICSAIQFGYEIYRYQKSML